MNVLGCRSSLLVAGFLALGQGVSCASDEVTACDSRDQVFLQSLLDGAGDAGYVKIPEGTFTISRPLIVDSGTHLRCSPQTTIRLADGANSPLIMNRPQKGMAHDITLEGGVWDGNNAAQKRCKHPSKMLGGKYGGGSENQMIVFAGVSNLVVRGLTIRNPEQYSTEFTDIEDFLIEDITFDCNELTLNEDGIHVNGFARRGVIRNIRGHTNDDLVALNSDEGEWRSSDNDIEDILVDGVDGGTNGWTAVRLLSRKANVRNVTIRNVRGKYKYNAVSLTHWTKLLEPGMGHFDNIVIENLRVGSCRTKGWGHGGLVWVQPGVQSVGRLIVRDYLREDSDDAFNVTTTLEVGANAKVAELVLENVRQCIPDRKPLVSIDPTATVGKIVHDASIPLCKHQ